MSSPNPKLQAASPPPSESQAQPSAPKRPLRSVRRVYLVDEEDWLCPAPAATVAKEAVVAPAPAQKPSIVPAPRVHPVIEPREPVAYPHYPLRPDR